MIWNFHLSAPTLTVRQTREKVVCKPEKRRKAVLDFIRSAKRSLLLSVFRCDDIEVLYELGEAIARGVDVHALITGRAKGWRKRLGPLASLLESMGVHVYSFAQSAMKYHAKFMVADGDRALIATSNLTRKCFRRTSDYVLTTQDLEVARSLASLFWADVAGAPIHDFSERLIVGPESRARIEALLDSARESIRIKDHKLSDPEVLRILRDRSTSGVTVHIDDGEACEDLKPHGRLIVVDEKIALLGSFALTQCSLDERREVAILVRDPKLVDKLNRKLSHIVNRLELVS
jgi:cardiolipin synthase